MVLAPQMAEERYREVVGRLKGRCFDVARPSRTPQGNRKD